MKKLLLLITVFSFAGAQEMLIYGQVYSSVTASGAIIPVANAHVGIGMNSVPEGTFTTTNEDGFYELVFDWNWDGPIPIVCEAENYEFYISTFMPNSTTSNQIEFDILLTPFVVDVMAVLEGHVWQNNGCLGGTIGCPIGGANISAIPTIISTIDDIFSTTSDDNGHYVLELPEGVYMITCSAEDWQTETANLLIGSEDTTHDFYLSEANNEEPCSDLSQDECEDDPDCDWIYNTPNGSGLCVEIEGEGCTDLEGIDFGDCDMDMGIAWINGDCVGLSGCGWEIDGVDYSDAFFETFEECEWVCADNQHQNGVLFGSVEYIWGDAIELVSGAIILIQDPINSISFTTMTNNNGQYETELPEGAYIVTASAYDESQTHDVYIYSNNQYELNFTFGEYYFETALTGFVYTNTTNEFAPIDNAHLYIHNSDGEYVSSTNEDGFFWINLPSVGNFYISVEAEGYLTESYEIFVEGITEQNFYLTPDDVGNLTILSLDNVQGLPGNEVVMPLYLSSTESVGGLQFSIGSLSIDPTLPNSLIPVGLEATDNCFSASFNEVNNQFIGIIFSIEGCIYPAGETLHIANLIYEITTTVPIGIEIPLEFYSTLVSDAFGNEIPSYGEGGSIVLGINGDINFDSEINVLDIVMLVNFILFIDEPTDFEYYVSDINQDNLLNVLDVVSLVNMILGIDNFAKDNLGSYGNVEIGKNLMNFYLDASIAGIQFDYSSNMNINLDQLPVDWHGKYANGKAVFYTTSKYPENIVSFNYTGQMNIENVLLSDRNGDGILVDILRLPDNFELLTPFPNPFNPVTTISYGLPSDTDITLNVYDVEGRKITTLTEGIRTAGTHSVEWNAEGYPSGVYFVKLDADEFTQTQKLMMVK